MNAALEKYLKDNPHLATTRQAYAILRIHHEKASLDYWLHIAGYGPVEKKHRATLYKKSELEIARQIIDEERGKLSAKQERLMLPKTKQPPLPMPDNQLPPADEQKTRFPEGDNKVKKTSAGKPQKKPIGSRSVSICGCKLSENDLREKPSPRIYTIKVAPGGESASNNTGDRMTDLIMEAVDMVLCNGGEVTISAR